MSDLDSAMKQARDRTAARTMRSNDADSLNAWIRSTVKGTTVSDAEDPDPATAAFVAMKERKIRGSGGEGQQPENIPGSRGGDINAAIRRDAKRGY